jgi:hypothetical protein
MRAQWTRTIAVPASRETNPLKGLIMKTPRNQDRKDADTNASRSPDKRDDKQQSGGHGASQQHGSRQGSSQQSGSDAGRQGEHSGQQTEKDDSRTTGKRDEHNTQQGKMPK